MNSFARFLLFTVCFISASYTQFALTALLEPSKEIVAAGATECVGNEITAEEIKCFHAIQNLYDYLWQTINTTPSGDCIQGITDGFEAWPEPNPAWSVTKQGIILQTENDVPRLLWTPWGEKALIGGWSGHNTRSGESLEIWKKITAALLSISQVTAVKSYQMKNLVLYDILKIDGEELPKPVRATSLLEPKEEDLAHKKWRYMIEKCGIQARRIVFGREVLLHV